MEPTKLDSSRALLAIRQAGRRRDTYIAATVFVLAFVSVITLSLLDYLARRELVLVIALTAVFGMSFIMAWVRLEIVKAAIELIDNL